MKRLDFFFSGNFLVRLGEWPTLMDVPQHVKPTFILIGFVLSSLWPIGCHYIYVCTIMGWNRDDLAIDYY